MWFVVVRYNRYAIVMLPQIDKIYRMTTLSIVLCYTLLFISCCRKCTVYCNRFFVALGDSLQQSPWHPRETSQNKLRRLFLNLGLPL